MKRSCSSCGNWSEKGRCCVASLMLECKYSPNLNKDGQKKAASRWRTRQIPLGVARDMQSDPEVRGKIPALALNACAPARLSAYAVIDTLMASAEQAQQAITVTMTFAKGKLTITENV